MEYVPYFEYFEQQNQLGKKWYWRLKAANHKIIAIGAEPFNSKEDVMEAVRTIVRLVPFAGKMHQV